MSEPLYAYLDTNVFVEFLPPRDLDWGAILGTKPVVLVISGVILRELNEIKDSGKYTAAKRQRVSQRMKWLHEILFDRSEDESVRLPNGVTIAPDLASVPEAIYSDNHLDRTIGDDRLIASAINGRERGWRVCVVTDDLGAKLQARNFGLESFAPPQDKRCSAEPDPRDKELRDLKAQLTNLLERQPKVTLGRANGAALFHACVFKPMPDSDEQVEHQLVLIRNMLLLESSHLKMIVLVRGATSEREKRRYSSECDRYIENIAPLLPEMIRHHNSKTLYVELGDLILSNVGTTPADAVEIHLFLPEMAHWAQEEPTRPKWQEAPELPVSVMDELARRVSINSIDRSVDNFVTSVGSAPPEFRIDGQTAVFRIAKLKHGQSKDLPRIFLAFKTHEDVGSLAIRYEVHADNLPYKAEGEIAVNVSKVDRYPQSEDIGYEPVVATSRRRL